MTDELHTTRVRPGWTLPGTVLGLVAAVGGWWVFRSVSQDHSACGLFDVLRKIPDTGDPGIACNGVSSRFTAGGVLVGSGGLLALVALLVGSRRGVAASRRGHPWPIRRLLTSVAEFFDRRLPGASKEPPRIGARAVGALLCALLVLSLIEAHALWASHRRASERVHRHVAELRLATLSIPGAVTTAPGVTGCQPSADKRCAFSPMTPEALRHALEAFLSGRSSTALCGVVPTATGMPCPVTVYGTVAGYPAVANVFQHSIYVKDGHPPAGAVPVRSNSKHAYFYGSEIYLSLLVPDI